MYRIGKSTDIHQLVVNRDMIIGGVKIPYEKGLLGHSDADVLLHAIAEAIIGALGLNDIGYHFDDKDPQYKNISSLILLEKVYKMMEERNYIINNIDSLIIIEKPRLRDYIESMRQNISNVLKTDISNINIKATCAEKLSFIGKEEGVLAEAVVLLRKEEKK